MRPARLLLDNPHDDVIKWKYLTGLLPDNSPVAADLTSHRPATRRVDVFFDLRLNKLKISEMCPIDQTWISCICKIHLSNNTIQQYKVYPVLSVWQSLIIIENWSHRQPEMNHGLCCNFDIWAKSEHIHSFYVYRFAIEWWICTIERMLKTGTRNSQWRQIQTLWLHIYYTLLHWYDYDSSYFHVKAADGVTAHTYRYFDCEFLFWYQTRLSCFSIPVVSRCSKSCHLFYKMIWLPITIFHILITLINNKFQYWRDQNWTAIQYRIVMRYKESIISSCSPGPCLWNAE